MISTLTVIHCIISILLILVVLLHFGKGAEAGLMMEASSSILPQKGNILNKLVTLLAILFFTISLGLAKLRGIENKKSVFDSDTSANVSLGDNTPAPAPPAPATPEATKTEETKTEEKKAPDADDPNNKQ